MSLEIDGFWKAGFWSTTFWADGFWFEGAPQPALPVIAGAGSGKKRRWTEDEIYAYVDALKDAFKKPEIPLIAKVVEEVREQAVALIEKVQEYREEKLEDLQPVRELLSRIEKQVQIYEELKLKEEMELAEEEEAISLLLLN